MTSAVLLLHDNGTIAGHLGEQLGGLRQGESKKVTICDT
jgi:hypothetical protein